MQDSANPHVLDKIMVDLLRYANTDSAGCERVCTGASYDPDSAMGKEHGKGD